MLGFSYKQIIIWAMVSAFTIFIIFGLSKGLREASIRESTPHIYEGVIASTDIEGGFVFYNGHREHVYFDNGDKITLIGNPVLIIGKKYEITTDGIGRLLTIRLID